MTLDYGHIPKVIFLNPWDRLIGPNRYLVEMLRQAPELAVRSTVVFSADNDARMEYRDLGCRTEVWSEIGFIHPRLTLGNAIGNIERHTVGLVRIARRLKDLHPDLVVSNSEILCVGGMAARWAKIPHIQVFHSLLFQYRRQQYGWTLGRFIRFLSLWTQCFIGVSQTVMGMLLAYRIKSSQMAMVPNGFDAQAIREKSNLPLPPALSDLIRGHHPILISVGRIAPMKGQDVLIQAVDRLRSVYPSILCLLVGRRGTQESMENVNGFFGHLTSLIRDRHLEDHIHFVGEVNCVPELIHHADVYVHPSFTESFSRVVAEALICEKPVVCTSAGALPEVVGPTGAIMVQPGNAEALAQGILQVLEEESLRQRIVSSGKNHVESRYSVFQTTRGFLEVLASVAGATNGRRRKEIGP